MLLIQSEPLGSNGLAPPPSHAAMPFIFILLAIVIAGIVIAGIMIVRTMLGKPDDKSGAGKTAVP